VIYAREGCTTAPPKGEWVVGGGVKVGSMNSQKSEYTWPCKWNRSGSQKGSRAEEAEPVRRSQASTGCQGRRTKAEGFGWWVEKKGER